MSSSHSNPSPEPEEAVRPIPPRLRWLKRGAIAFGLFVIAFITMYLGWSKYAQNRLQAEIDRITASGEPLFPDDFNAPPIPDSDNAAVLYKKAAQLISDSGANKSPLFSKCLDLSADDSGFVSSCGGLITRHEIALALAREARNRPNVSWSIRVKSPLIGQELPDFKELRTLTKLLRIKTELNHARRLDGEVVQDLKDILALSMADDQAPGLISHLVAVSVEALAMNTIETLAPTLAVETAGDPANNKSTVRAGVKYLIERLMDDESLDGGIVRALQFERAMQFDVVLNVSSDQQTAGEDFGVNSEISPWSTMPLPLVSLLKLDGVAMLEHMSHQIKAVRFATFPSYNEYLNSLPTPPWTRPANLLERLHHIFSRMLTPSLSRSTLLHYRLLADRRMAAAALAIRIYEIDHGHRPPTLDILIPDYLPEIPTDPFSSNGVVQYLPDAEHPRLYSVGPDGVDDGGEFAFKRGGVINWEALDMAFFLDGQPPPPSEDDSDSSPR